MSTHDERKSASELRRALNESGVVNASLNDWRDAVHELARAKGWHENSDPGHPLEMSAKIALIHSELSEALEAVRDAEIDAYIDAKTGKPEGVEVELADVIIRVLDFAGALNIDIASAVALKHEFNMSRSRRHGGKAL